MTTEDALELLTAEVGQLVPGAALLDNISASRRAVTGRFSVDGTTVIAKRHHEPEAFALEAEAYRMLPEASRPALVARGKRVVVMEDLGTGPSLADLLLGDDAAAASHGLTLWASTLGAALHPSLRRGQRAEPLDLTQEVASLVELAATFDVVAPPGLDADAADLVAPLNAETNWFAFGPSDACPDNNKILADGTMKLFDFEGAGWRHAGSEGAYTRGPFCTCWCVAALPDGAKDAMTDAFMAALQPDDPEAFRATLSPIAAAYVLQSMKYFAYFLEHDQPMGPPGREPNTGRQLVPFRLDFIAEHNEFPVLGALARDLAQAIRRRWPDTPELQLYAAFR